MAIDPRTLERSTNAARPLPAAVLIARVGRVVRQGMEQALEPVGLRQRQLVALGYLRDHGPSAQRALAHSLRMDASSLVCLLNELEDRSLVARRRDPADRRRGIVELSAEGERVLCRVDKSVAALDEEILTGLDDEERDALRSMLARLPAGALDWSVAVADEA
jgi:DNA-binding MarR family transcriptional regulator